MAKKSLIEREKKRLLLTKKYAVKRQKLLEQFAKAEDFDSKLEIHSKIQKLPIIVQKPAFEIDAGKQAVQERIFVILVYHDMFSEKWLTKVYYQE